MPTDTIYGLCAAALNQEAVERTHRLKGRPADSPFIVLVAGWPQIEKLGIELTAADRAILEKNWPGPASFVLPCPRPELAYLHRGTDSLAVRWPADEQLAGLISLTGPIIATSANLSGQPPAKTIEEAEAYFGGRADFYIDGGTMDKPASTLAKLANGKAEVLRQGEYRIKT
jgi:tRNA threonylcarbamoyl adenosine modification protein (Sua5/YciO/YrdC/YwlC family)